MFLKRIQVNGFKSFADKITIPLDRGINGIVGPNGSGKSNIIDAVRWVMGEQNAKNLRGKVAVDIIFSGSAKRKALGQAEVSLTFDNTEASEFCPPEYQHDPEITLTRRIYTDGQREYLINKKPSRLKDILDFFAITGLGSKSYSMIQQGQVDRILGAKPEDVRLIVEEAAGTLVYKKKRDESLAKLTQTEENLSRVQDLITELEKQKQSLTSQMEKAKTYRALHEELVEVEKSYFLHLFVQSKDAWDAKQKVLVENQNEAEMLQANLLNIESKLNSLQTKLDEVDPDLAALQESVMSMREQIVRAETIIQTSDQKVSFRKERLDEVSQDLEGLEEDCGSTQSRHDAIAEELVDQKAKLKDAESFLENFEDEIEKIDEEHQVFHSQVEDLEMELQNIENYVKSNSERCRSINEDRDRLRAEKAQLEEDFEREQDSLTALKKEVSSMEAKAGSSTLTESLDKKKTLEAAIVDANQKIEDYREKQDRLKEELFSKKASLQTTEEQLKVSDETERLLELLDGWEDKISWLGQDLQMKDPYQELSTNMKNQVEELTDVLLVKDMDALNAVLDLVRQEQIEINLQVLIADLQKVEAGFEKNLEDVDKLSAFCQSEHPLVAGFLDQVVVCSDISSLPADLKVSGVLLHAKGLSFFGAAMVRLCTEKRSGGRLSLKKRFETETAELNRVQDTLAASSQDLESWRTQIKEWNEELTQVKASIDQENEAGLKVQFEIENKRQELDYQSKAIGQIRSRLEQIEQRMQSLAVELEKLGQDRISYASEKTRITAEIEELKERFSDIDARKEELGRQKEQKGTDVTKLQVKTEATEEKLEQIFATLAQKQEQLDKKRQEKNRLEDEIEQIKSEHAESLVQIDSMLKKREEYEEQLTSKKSQSQGLVQEIRETEKSLKEKSLKLKKIDQEISELKLGGERFRLKMESALEQAKDRLHLDLETYLSEHAFEARDDFDERTEHKKTEQLRTKIDKLGAINMMAIEEFEEVSTRLDFIYQQRQEVEESIALIQKTIGEVEETSKRKFLETYATITQEFSELFPILFPGGEARLELLDPEDPLNSGVEILARLPGKKYQRMTLLSGGEKALTAISLIFALLKTKPTPFCFLDEVDAPLDEANVGRYNKILEALSDRFQFILITHNRRTMEVLDALFGVTMQEPGVSKVVGVDMKKDIPQHLRKAFQAPKSTAESSSRAGATAQDAP